MVRRVLWVFFVLSLGFFLGAHLTCYAVAELIKDGRLDQSVAAARARRLREWE